MATAPYGLIPVGLIGGEHFAGSTRNIPIASGYATAIGFGDLVSFSSGTIVKNTNTSANTVAPVGVFLGCSWTDPTYGKRFSQQWPASTVASDAVAIVCDDPKTVFKMALVSGTTVVVGATSANCLGKNSTLVQNAVNTATGNSQVALLNTPATTNTLPIRIIDVVPGSDTTTAGTYTEVLVKINAGMHHYDAALGI